MFPKIAYACATQPLGELFLAFLNLSIVTAGLGVVLIAPVVGMMMFLIPKYRTRGFKWVAKVAVVIGSLVVVIVLPILFFFYLYLDNVVFSLRNEYKYTSEDVRADGRPRAILKNPLCAW